MALDNTIFPTEDQIPDKYKPKVVEQRRYLIDGELREWKGDMQEITSPVCVRSADGSVKRMRLGSTPLHTGAEALSALEAAVTAYNGGRGEWPSASVGTRVRYMEKFVAEMLKAREPTIKLLALEIGKTEKDATTEFDRTVEYINATIKAVKELDMNSARIHEEGGVLAMIKRAPLGTVLCMGPYNYPLNETYTTLIPALIMGNTVVFKPAKYGVLLHQPLLDAYNVFPKGVVNTVYGDGRVIVTPMMQTGKFDALAFIGSCSVANDIMRNHPKLNRLKPILGLGAKNPSIILEDGDLEVAVKEGVLGALSYNGQRCTALKTHFVPRKLAGEYVARLSEAVDKLVIGMPWTPNVGITPLPEDGYPQKMDAFVQDALAKGAKIANPKGGQINETIYSPAVIYPVNDTMDLYWKEQFGPVIPVVPYDDIEEVLAYAPRIGLGQQASIFTRDAAKLGRTLDVLSKQFCRINLNCQCQRGPDSLPFSGRGDSAVGTLDVEAALRAFSIRTLYATKDNPVNREITRKVLADDSSQFLSTDYYI
jgi:acyl-CoA reductase-like NAD-dependent aldehyde dehydrogenase